MAVSENLRFTQQHFDRFLNKWKVFYQNPTESDVAVWIEKIKTHELIHPQENIGFALFKPNEFRYLYVGNKVGKILGCSQEALMDLNTRTFSKLFPIEHFHYFPTILRWTKQVDQEIGPSNRQKMFYSGLKFVYKKDQIRRLSIRADVLGYASTNLPYVTLHTFEDVTHLWNREHFWGRFIGKGGYTRFFKSGGVKNEFRDLLSKREMEVLQLVALNYSSRVIAGKLKITESTVKRHRKNMLFRAGVKDSTALLQICKMIDMSFTPVLESF